MTTGIVPQSTQPAHTLYHTNFDAFARALRAVAPELQRTATEYQTTFHARGVPLSERESLGYAVTHLLEVVAPYLSEDDYYDAEAYHRSYEVADYNDEELLACGVDHS